MAVQAFVEHIRYNTRKHEPEEEEEEDWAAGYCATRQQLDSSFSEALIMPLSTKLTCLACTNLAEPKYQIKQPERAAPHNPANLIRVQYSSGSKPLRVSIFSHPSIISVMLVFYIIISSDLSLNTILNITSSTATIARNPHDSNELNALTGERSLLQMVEASPAPAPASARAAAASHRMPPVNGSIFGKRSLDTLSNRKRRQRDGQIASDGGAAARQHQSDPVTTASKPANYNEIITDLIEEFLYQNNESEPEETTVAFCRMIVYECNQVLRAHPARPTRRSPSTSTTRR